MYSNGMFFTFLNKLYDFVHLLCQHVLSLYYRGKFHDVTLPEQCKNWSIMAVLGHNCR